MVVQLPPEAIVVGVDSSQEGGLAVLWALDLASHTHQPVHMVHVQPPPPGRLTDAEARRQWDEAGQAVVAAAVAQGEQTPGVLVSGESVDPADLGTPETLVAVSRRAAMLVVGARGHGAYTGLLMGSVSQHVTRHAVCPVVTVRRQADRDERRVVVGVDRRPDADDALELAFRLAGGLRADLTAIHVWHAPALHGVGVNRPMPGDTGHELRRHEQELNDLLAPWQQKFPQTTVVPEVIPGSPAEVLTDASEHAALLVVGSRQRDTVTELLLGSVAQSVLRHAHCPVAVAH